MTDPEVAAVGPRETTGAFPSAPVAADWTEDGRPFSCSRGSGLAANDTGAFVSLLLVAAGGTASVRSRPHSETPQVRLLH